MSDVWPLKLPHSRFQDHIPMHSLLIFQGWPVILVTKLDSVNQQFVPFEVSKPATKARDYKEILSMDWCSTRDFLLNKQKTQKW